MSEPGDAPNILAFWRDAGPSKWFAKDAAFDAELWDRFLDEHFAAARREREHLLDTPDGALALILLLDQVPRNVFRDSAHAFATDPLALAYARRAIDAGFDTRVDPALRVFVYLPLEHSEDLADQDRCVALCEAMGDANYLKYAEAHREVIRRFGRFPHRRPRKHARGIGVAGGGRGILSDVSAARSGTRRVVLR